MVPLSHGKHASSPVTFLYVSFVHKIHASSSSLYAPMSHTEMEIVETQHSNVKDGLHVACSFHLCRTVVENTNVKCEHHHLLP